MDGQRAPVGRQVSPFQAVSSHEIAAVGDDATGDPGGGGVMVASGRAAAGGRQVAGRWRLVMDRQRLMQAPLPCQAVLLA